MAKYIVTQDSHSLKKGEIVYDFHGYDYGCSSDDTRTFGEQFVKVTYDSSHMGSFMTIEERKIKEIK